MNCTCIGNLGLYGCVRFTTLASFCTHVPKNTTAPLFVRPPLINQYLVSRTTHTSCYRFPGNGHPFSFKSMLRIQYHPVSSWHSVHLGCQHGFREARGSSRANAHWSAAVTEVVDFIGGNHHGEDGYTRGPTAFATKL